MKEVKVKRKVLPISHPLRQISTPREDTGQPSLEIRLTDWRKNFNEKTTSHEQEDANWLEN